jgi:hypothetical protein
VGQLGKLRADWQSALGRVAKPPQDAKLPHRLKSPQGAKIFRL